MTANVIGQWWWHIWQRVASGTKEHSAIIYFNGNSIEKRGREWNIFPSFVASFSFEGMFYPNKKHSLIVELLNVDFNILH